MGKEIHKVIAIIIEGDEFLMVRKTGKDIWTNLGGRVEAGESEEQALKREVREELSVDIKINKKLGDFVSRAIFDDADVKLSAYLGNLIGDPIISDEELEEFRFIGNKWKEQGIKLPPSIVEKIIPFLVREKYLSDKYNG